QMDKALAALGFSIRVATVDNKLRIYEHKPTGARFWLAYLPDDAAVLPHHMAAVEGTLRVHGIADPREFMVDLIRVSQRRSVTERPHHDTHRIVGRGHSG